MYLTRFHLNARRAGGRKLLGSPQAMHAAVLSSFAAGVEPGRVLWRVDDDSDPLRPAVYVVSPDPPDVTHIEEQGGWPQQTTAQQADYTPLLDRLAEGQSWAFRLTANPTHRATIAGRKKVVAHVTAAQQLRWLLERSTRIGCDLGSPEEPSCTVTRRSVLRFRRNGESVTLGVARFEGTLKVTDAELLRGALTKGVGRAKAYGCGLLTLAAP